MKAKFRSKVKIADVVGDMCIHDDVGQIMIFALLGCSSSLTDTDDKM
jgi:hypothetical protein